MNLKGLLISERERVPLFSPVVLGIGIILGVFIPFTNWAHLAVFLIASALIAAGVYFKSRLLGSAILIFSLGVYVAQTGGILRTDLLSQKQFITKELDNIEFEATVQFVDETHPTMRNMRRLTFRDMKVPGLDFVKTAKMTCPARVTEDIFPGDVVKIRGKLSPFKLPAIPGSFDPMQYNSLIGLDATGIVYSVSKVAGKSSRDLFSGMRRSLTHQIIKRMSSPSGGIASALITGDKTSIPPEVRDSFINSGTAHILAISGLHMSIVSSIVFCIFLKFFQYLGLIVHVEPRKLSAIVTIFLAFLYLALSGFSPSATRAFIMTTVFLGGVIFGRGSLSLRSVSLAAFLILLFDSGALFLVSFQLSFCAVVALIAFYEAFQQKLTAFRLHYSGVIWTVAFYIIASVISTTVASLATFPVSVAVFNRLSLSGTLGNLVAIPGVTFVIVPLGIVSLACGKFIDFPVDLLDICLGKFASILHYIANIPGSNLTVKSPDLLVLYVIVLGGILLCLLRTRARLFGFVPIAIGGVLWFFQKPPVVVFPPGIESVCFIEDDQFFVDSIQKGRRAFLSIQRNLGFSGKLMKRKFGHEIRMYPFGMYIWKSGKSMQLADRKHPYCPAYFTRATAKAEL